MLKALCQSLCLALPLAASAQPASVVFLNPGLSTETFWTSYTRFMQAAADELGMTLRVEYSERRADQCESTEGREHRAGALESEHAEHHGDAVQQLGVGLGHGVSLGADGPGAG